ncbi:MAG: cytochrome c1 [Planctomycetaceae bacterium]|nr:cytochrome c1 [Planctomycetaceae bacterium]
MPAALRLDFRCVRTVSRTRRSLLGGALHVSSTQYRVLSMRCAIVSLATCISLLFATHAPAVQANPLVPGYERFFAEDDAHTANGGALLLGELNCLSCHEALAALSAYVQTKQAPILDNVGQRVRPEFLREYLAAPHKAKPGTTMPDLLASASESERIDKVEALVHFLASTGKLREAAPITPAVTRGETLFHTVGCVACHQPSQVDFAKLSTSVPLPAEMEKKYTLPGLAEFLQNPLHVRPSGRMPHLNLNEAEARDVASYLLRNLEVAGVVEYAYYEGSWQDLPDFSKLEPKSKGKTTSFDVNIGRPDQFGIVFKALFDVAQEGEYTFHIGSDDGSRIRVDGKEVAVVPGVHPVVFKSGKVKLTDGTHEAEVEFFEQGGGQELKVEYEGPGIKRQSLEYALMPPEDKAKDEKKFVVKPELVVKGRALFGSLGCASCHQLRIGNQQIASAVSAKPLTSLDNEKGCLADSPAKVPDFHLSKNQRVALAAAIKSLNSPNLRPARPTDAINATLTAFNCYACHQRGEVGGVERSRNALFNSNQPEMGDEGRIPPHLTGVGAKLKPGWLKQVFDDGAKDRPYMFTRMPRFGSQNVGHLIKSFAEADPPVADHSVATNIGERKVKSAGRKLSGSQGFSCIKCHTWGNVKATGIQSINMVTLTRRLQENWFHHYMLNPQQYRPGTRMPAAWPQGQVLLPNLLDGKALTQVNSIWRFLDDGDKAAMPVGLGANPIVLAAYDEAIIYRNFIEGAGPRAIGVGYPEQVNQAFDANNLRIALLWHGAFIDASKHWLGRGQGFQPPLGDNVLKLPEGVSFAVLENPETSWPTVTAKDLGYRFRGYRLGEARRPAFRYQIGNASVEDELVATSKKEFTSVRRTLTITATEPIDNLWYRAATGNTIAMANGVATIDDSWRVRVTGGKLRKSNGAELLVPVRFVDGKATIVQEYEW